ncbi:MAG: hypothetical protein PHV02_00210 [Rhodocyclaceae bacterium]|nr:hypothetical protein [Rhodocyclaceae bacterium]
MINIHLHDLALAHILASAFESYIVPLPSNLSSGNHIPVETCGSLFGRKTVGLNGNSSTVQLDLTYASVHTIVDRQPNSCESYRQSDVLHQAVHMQIMPTLEYMGDFHSHPCRCGEALDDGTTVDIRLINRQGLYRFSGSPGSSEGDFGNVRQMLQVGPYYLGIVVTLYRMRTAGSLCTGRYLDHFSAIEFPYYGDDGTGKTLSFRCWIKAHVFDSDSALPVDDTSVKLYCPVLGMSQTMFC